MRVFSKFEKRILLQIVNLEKTDERLISPGRILKDQLNIKSQVYIIGRGLKYELKEGETYYHKIEVMGDEKDFPTDYFEVTDRFYETNNLIDYLLKDGYLLRHEGGRFIGFYINMQEDLVEKEVQGKNIYINNSLKEFLDKCSYYYTPTEALRDLVEHNFRTKSERNSYWTRIISILSICISLLGIGLNFWVNSRKEKREEPQTFKIDSTSIDYYINKTKELVDTTKLKTPDTINKNQKVLPRN